MQRHRYGHVALVLAALLLLVGGPAGLAQSKKSAKQAESLSKAGDNAKKSVEDALASLSGLLEGYNSIMDGSAKNPQSAYKKLVGDLKSTEKQIEGIQKNVEAMNKEAAKFFSAWESDVEQISKEDLKQKSVDRLNASKDRYASLGETLGEAREAFKPVVQDLNDQILFLGRDMSPEAIADLQDEAAALNQSVEELSEKLESMIESAGSTEVDTGSDQ